MGSRIPTQHCSKPRAIELISVFQWLMSATQSRAVPDMPIVRQKLPGTDHIMSTNEPRQRRDKARVKHRAKTPRQDPVSRRRAL
jgi:hypothetical protein